MMNKTAFEPVLFVESSAYSGRDIVLLALYLLTSITAVLGNVFVCLTIYRKRRLTTSSTYALLFNMAASDVVGGLVIPAQWISCSSWSLNGTIFGVVSCGVLKQLQILSYYISSLTMVAIRYELNNDFGLKYVVSMFCNHSTSYDRYCLVCRPMSARPGTALLLTVIWIFGLLFISSMSIIVRVSEYFSPDKVIFNQKCVKN